MNKISDIKISKKKHIAIKSDAHEDHLTVHRARTDETSHPSDSELPHEAIARKIGIDETTKNNVLQKAIDNKTVKNFHHTASEKQEKHAMSHNTMDENAHLDSFEEAREADMTQNVNNENSIDRTCPDSIKTMFMGTGDFASHILNEMLKHKKCNLIAVVTQPDKKLGRKKSGISRSLAANPVRDIAATHNIPLIQPFKFDDAAVAHITQLAPDAIVVASYGKILPKAILDLPKYGAINIHTSLLPQLRGASPIQNALLLGLKETGVTIMKMDEGMDTGDILAQQKISIDAHEKANELTEKLSRIGAKLFIDTCPNIINEKIALTKQDHSKATLCQMIDREDGHIQWTDTTEEIYNRYRALYPWPGIFSYWEATESQMMRLKLRGIYPYTGELTEAQKELLPGTVFIARDQLCIKTFDSAIILEAIQPECKVVMPVYDFLNGYKNFEGAILR